MRHAHTAMNGSPGESSRSGAAAAGVPISRFAAESAPKNRTAAATPLSESPRHRQLAMQRREPRPSATSRVTARPMPDVHAGMPSAKMEKISW